MINYIDINTGDDSKSLIHILLAQIPNMHEPNEILSSAMPSRIRSAILSSVTIKLNELRELHR
jgi:hypothetical protein